MQDYHFALLPRLIKQKRHDARVAIFWHIPWPNPEAFGICPWQRELLDGLLGADLIGFHVSRTAITSCRQPTEFGIAHRLGTFLRRTRRSSTMVRPFPISVASPGHFHRWRHCADHPVEHSALLKAWESKPRFVGVGVDRLDYTKGILERFLAVERFLEKYPRYQGQFTFIQIGAPSRSDIKRYHDLQAEVEAEADRINWRFRLRPVEADRLPEPAAQS